MGLFINNQAYGTPYINGVRMKTAYINGRNIWPPTPPDSFHVQFVDAATGLPIQGAITPKWTQSGPNLEYKTTHGNWTEFSSGTQITSELDGIIHFRGTGRTRLYSSSENRIPWIATQPLIARGRLANLLEWEQAETLTVSDPGFVSIFGSASSKILEAYLIFNKNSGGTGFCYSMVWGSTIRKFVGRDMNKVTLGTDAYIYGFQNCTSLTYIDVDFLAWSGNNSSWFWESWSSTGTFYKPASLPTERGNSRIPANWTVIDKE
jgi:hypothetical protein